ncbi:KH domain RNA binding protein YlqC [Liquorilactobacillus sucicola DSM 21376 = JCM 15457]|uniref:RNA-binding protein KhpA n=1 Tax=Liquorilactobacillus sucicola DSM 21376 = JCM 15457 TaxID=1423806 RepID=A0A023CUN9_9LACO|nr:KH domain-containing protein [Liquorilactobacillus sucicola]KRN05236.1 hypothetical protein FD15_GL001781 [Liquorilactobacillus sucicola DSM 21376 = JCM 15457]GAJ25296.1 KH domain RNA binding protein YlqC [Liquorilactobacillus sucicola DSM 21376 = JCM 15457]
MAKADVKQLIITIVKPLVAEPDKIELQLVEEGHFINFNLRVAPKDVGRVIGKQGRIAQAIRTIVYSVCRDDSHRVRLNIIND